jgi:protein CLEC16A
MELGKLNAASSKVIGSASSDTISAFVQEVEAVPIILANCADSFHSKLIALAETGLFSAMKCIMKNPIDISLQLKLLKFWDFLISTSGSVAELTLVFSDQLVNTLILYPFDFSTTEVLQSYVTVLKGISMHAKDLDVANLFTRDGNDCPLYSHAVPFIVSKDSVVVSAARLVVLHLCHCRNPILQSFICAKVIRVPFTHLIDNANSDDFVFLGEDLLTVAPLELFEFLLAQLEAKLKVADLAYVARAVLFLEGTQARFLLVNAISERLCDFPLNSPITMALFLRVLEKRLLLLDSAIKWGIIPSRAIPTFSGSAAREEGRHLLDEVMQILLQRLSVVMVALPLRIIEKLNKEISSVIFELNRALIQEIKGIDPFALMEPLIGRFEPRHRCDLDFLLRAEEKDGPDVWTSPPKARQAVMKLAEVQASIGRYTGKHFAWFQLDEGEDARHLQTFQLANGHSLSVSACAITEEGESLNFARFFVMPVKGKAKKAITIVTPPQVTERRVSLISLKMAEKTIEMQSAALTTLKGIISKAQREIIDRMLDKLPQ